MQQHITVTRRHLTEHKTDDPSQTVVVGNLCFVYNSVVLVIISIHKSIATFLCNAR